MAMAPVPAHAEGTVVEFEAGQPAEGKLVPAVGIIQGVHRTPVSTKINLFRVKKIS
jgi:hypothetical protein